MWPLILAISGLSILGWFVNTFTPDTFFRMAFFFLIAAITTFFFSLSILKIVRRAVLVALGVVILLLLRFLGLRDWYYPILLIPVLISLEILLQKR